MKGKFILILSVICIFSLFSAAAAYDSPFEKKYNTEPEGKTSFVSIKQGLTDTKQNTEEEVKTDTFAADFNTPLTDKTRTEGSMVINSLEPLFEADEQMLAVFRSISGLRFDYTIQNGSVPMTSFNLSLPDFPIVSYALQRTNPYFISSNFLGENTFMINEDDKFEEKLVDAVYRMVEKSGIQREMPDINEVYNIIQSIRDGSMNISPVPMQQSFEFTQEIDSSAFESIMMNLMMHFTEATPEAENNYFYTDLPQNKKLFSWPAFETLPAFQVGSAAISAAFNQQDLLNILNAFSKFFADNPELTETINQVVLTSMAQSNPEMAQMEGVDVLSEILSGLKENISANLKDFTLIFKMDQDMYGTPVLFTIELINRTETESTDTVIRFHMSNDLNGAVFEAAVDSIQGQQTLPIIRALLVSSTDEEGSPKIKINFRMDDWKETAFEYAQLTEIHSSANKTIISNSDISFDLNGERSNAAVFTTGIPNDFGGKDEKTQITFTHISQGTPLITASLSGESKTSEALPGLTASDAVAVSQMNESDYDALVSNFFMNIMMLSMIFG